MCHHVRESMIRSMFRIYCGNNSVVCLAHYESTIRIWFSLKHDETREIGHPDVMFAVVFLPQVMFLLATVS